MNISRKLVAVGLAFSALGGTCAFARPAPCFENVRPWRKQNTVETHIRTAPTPSATDYAGSFSPTNTVKDDWPANMHQE
jgi:hypothetical protein